MAPGATKTVSSASPGPTPSPIESGPAHDAVQQARNLRQVLGENKQRIGCFLGAGCPLGIYDAAGSKSLGLIPGVEQLTKRVVVGLETQKPPVLDAWKQLYSECKSPDVPEPTVEHVLSELRTLSNRRGGSAVLGMTKPVLAELDTAICKLIVGEMTKSLPSHRHSYAQFASWIAGLQGIHPVEVFTPNYDLLFEQAFEQTSLPHFDGFVGSREPWFDLASIEHDVLPPRWTRLWKLHGSINWERIEETVGGAAVARIVRVAREAQGRVMIYPSHLKYDQSRRMPYLAMLDRLRGFFRSETPGARAGAYPQEADAPRMVLCGYSFLDDHLNEALLDGLRGNRNAHCFALMYNTLAEHPRAVEYAQKQSNLTVLARDGAVVGTRKGPYSLPAAVPDEHKPWLYDEDVASTGGTERKVRSRLGDFHYFGLFLERLSGRTTANGLDA